MDKGYGQGDTSPKQLSGHHLDTGSLPPLDCTEHSRVGLAGVTGTACFPPLRAERNLYAFSSQAGAWVSQVTTPSTLGSAYLYHEISTIITLFCVQSNYFYFNLHYSNFCTDLGSSTESELVTANQSSCSSYLGLNDLG